MFHLIVFACGVMVHGCGPVVMPTTYATVEECRANGSANKIANEGSIGDFFCFDDNAKTHTASK